MLRSLVTVIVLSTGVAGQQLTYPVIPDGVGNSSGWLTYTPATNSVSISVTGSFPGSMGWYGPAARGQTGPLIASLTYTSFARRWQGVATNLTPAQVQALQDGLTYIAGLNLRAQVDTVPGTLGPGFRLSGSATPGGTLSFSSPGQNPFYVLGFPMAPGVTLPLPVCYGVSVGFDLTLPFVLVPSSLKIPAGLPTPATFVLQGFDLRANNCLASFIAHRITVL